MCRPEHYGVEYEINPWMNRQREVDHPLAVQQWDRLRDVLIGAGAEIELLPAVAGLPDLVFTANAALIHGRSAILSHFRHPQRQAEEPHDAAWFSAHGFETRRMPREHHFEGAGDALFCGDTLVAGYRIRSDALSHQLVAKMIGQRVIPVELVDPYYYHLDTCFCPLTPTTAIYYPAALDDYGRQALAESIDELIDVAADEAVAFACNAVVVGRHVVTNVGCPRLHAELKSRGFEPVATPLGEFVKSGGSAKCLTLRLDGEEAASWKQSTVQM